MSCACAASSSATRTGRCGSKRCMATVTSSSRRENLERGIAMRLKYSDVTPEAIYLNRRAFMVGAAALFVTGAAAEGAAPPEPAALAATPNTKFRLDDPPTKYEAATTYNNFYEFGTDKGDPVRRAASLRPRPWSVVVDGLVAKPDRKSTRLNSSHLGI